MKKRKVGNNKKNIDLSDERRHELSRNEKGIIAFLATFIMVVAVGVLGLFAYSHIKNKTDDIDNNTKKMSYTKNNPPGNMVKVPMAGTAENVVVDSEEVEQAEALVETDEYTHIVETGDENSITLGFAGDILFDPNYAIMNSIKNSGGISNVIDSDLMSEMNAVDIMMVNNEFPYSTGGSPIEGKTYTFRADPSSASMLNEMGVDIVSVANNHAFDYGETAFLDTIETLGEYGVVCSGGGENIDEASHPIYYIAENGLKIAIISATQIERLENPDTRGATDTASGVFRCLDDTLLLQRIKEAREENAFVIVFIHWGTESQTDIDWWQEKQAAEITEAGANLIIGCHPHILQKVGYVNGVPVIYSLGNYLFNSKTLDTCLVEVTIHTDGELNLQFIPAIQSGCSVKMATGSDYTRILDYMNSISDNAMLDANGYISQK
ncbi:MAG: CapA family protein [Butyrivibrio sp.]|nr:CapA family protein [Butyrivibrio sp.]